MTPKQKKKTRNKVEKKKKKKMMAAQSFEGSPAQQRVGTTSVCAPKSTTTKFCCTMHVRKRRPALLKKLCPPALCDKNQVPSMCFFFLVSSNGLLKEGEDGVLFAGRGGDTREVFGGEDKVVQGKETSPSRLQQDNTPVWGEWQKGEG